MYPVNQSIAHSDDVHHQATLLRAWDQEYTQLRAGDFTGSVGTLATPGIKLFSEQMNRAVFQTGALPEGRLAFGLPLRASGRCRICGEDGTADDVLVFSGRSGFEFVSPDLFTFVGIEIDPASSEDPVFVGMVALLERVISSDRRSIRIDPAKAAKLGRLLTAMLSDDGPGARLEEWPDQAAAFNRGLVGWLLDMLQPSEPDGGPVTPRHWQAISAIRQMVKTSPCCPISVAELTVELGLSRRTLQNACQEIVGMSPVQYLRALRLSEARRMMQRATSVTEVATQFGFWHLGYFSRDYQMMFGELPSATLRRWRAPTGDAVRDTRPRRSQRPYPS
ncbi:MAG: helix-turn-helix domain-containing protein [Rhodobacter sp.]|jgi:AraC family ethanolamine operon transcriptional activator|nr:helix-turn-helix domain-containing protein [Rhodobacter sp.]